MEKWPSVQFSDMLLRCKTIYFSDKKCPLTQNDAMASSGGLVDTKFGFNTSNLATLLEGL